METWCVALPLLAILTTGQARQTAHPGCARICREARGLGADACMAECRSHTDAAQDPDQGLRDFVADRSYNQPSGRGGEAMQEAYHRMHPRGERVPDCVPKFKGEPTFDDVDVDGDGVITVAEATTFAEQMCVSDKMAMQMFTVADADQDKALSREEFAKVGEETTAEHVVDKVADEQTEGDQQYNEVKTPPFEEFDEDGDGFLNGDELRGVVSFEFHRRLPGASDEEINKMVDDSAEDLAKLMTDFDKDSDGQISKSEWYSEKWGEQAGMGEELQEAAKQDENAEAPDDLERVEHPTQVPLPESSIPSGPAPSPVVEVVPTEFHVQRALVSTRHRHRASARGRRGFWIPRLLAASRRSPRDLPLLQKVMAEHRLQRARQTDKRQRASVLVPVQADELAVLPAVVERDLVEAREMQMRPPLALRQSHLQQMHQRAIRAQRRVHLAARFEAFHSVQRHGLRHTTAARAAERHRQQ